MSASSPPSEAWLNLLDDEDLAFMKRFVLASGSLKKVALDFGVSYPTIRSRLDRLIAKAEVADRHREERPFEQLLRSEYIDGKLEYDTFKQLLEANRKEMEESA